MKVLLPSTGTELSFVSDGSDGWLTATLNGAASGTFGSYVGGAIHLKGETRLTKKDVRSIDLIVRVPLFTFASSASENAAITAQAVGTNVDGITSHDAYVQAKITLTVPNGVPFRDPTSAGVALPSDQGAANLLAAAIAVEALLSCVIRQGTEASPTLAHGEYLVKPALGATGWLDSNHPLFLGAYGAVPFNGTDREPAIAAST